MNRWWLYIGIFLVCSGLGTAVGIVILIIYFYDDIRKHFKFLQNTYTTYNINNLNIHSDEKNHYEKNDFDTPMDHMSKESREEMR